MEKRSDMVETRSTTSEEIDDILDQTVVNSAKEKWKDASGETTDALTEGRIKRMKVDQLKRELMKLNIKPIGKKEELRNILIKQLERNTAEKVSDSEEAESDVSDEDTYASSKDATRSARHKSKEWTRKQRATRGTLRNLSTLLEWNDVQMLLYAKRMLKSSTKQFVTYETGLTSWKILKKRLKHEFKTEVNSAIVHAQLAKRRRRQNERARQYIGALQEIASQGNVEDEALIEHIINGIQDEEMIKTMLYGAYKAKGLKCFNCNNFGHIAPNCSEGKKSKQSGAKVNSIPCNGGELRVSIDNVTCCALVDTGSEHIGGSARIHDMEVILGRDFLNRVELCINKGLITVKTAGDNKSESYIEHSETNKRDSNVDKDIIDLLSIDFIEKDELSAYTSYDDKLKTVVSNYKPAECVKTAVETKIVLRNQDPIYSRPRRLSPKEKDVRTNQGMVVPVEKESQKYTSFVTPSGQYEFAKTPFGLCNSPAVFLRFIQEVFKHLIACKVVLTYMDDLIVPDVNNEDAFQKLKRVEYLGYEIEDGFVYPSPAKIKTVQYFPTPSSRKQIQSFLGLTGYFRKFIRDYAKIARPLSDLRKDNVKFSFSIEQLKSFEMLKAALANKPTLRIYNPAAITELHTDASKDGYGAILLQKDVDEKHFHPVYFMSRKTSDAERNYHSYELEILAVIKAVQKFRVYLLGIKFKLFTDCDTLRKTLHKFNPSPKIARWALILEEFDYEVEHRPGSQLPHEDALSRYPVLIVEDTVLALVRKKQDENERIRVIKQVLRTEPYENYIIENSVLMKEINNKKVIVLPAMMVTEIIRKVHENGHFGIKKMTERIKDEYYIPNLEAKLEKWYRMVDRVQRSINSTYQRSIGMSPFELMFGTKMRQAEDIRILDIIQQEVVDNFDNERSELRINAKKNLLKIQEGNRRVYNKKRKAPTKYVVGDLVVIKKTQYDPGSKLKAKFLGPNRVSGVRRNDKYEVIRVGGSEGSRITTTAVDCMKPYDVNSSENEEYAGMAECRTPRAR
ncbi:uncharacterized protein LOC143260735 [Megalopta genalis]|uniref:uncharacterized protein LOC143260735 n=1 Tax=Megalopta genalis TaxID=115081 RepID=UPI003FD6B9A9